jgi:SNF2 family DNA or RNA helicase
VNIRRVRLLSNLEPRILDTALQAPRPRRVRGPLDRVRVRSIWLRGDEGDLRTRWGWTPNDQAVAGEAPKKRAAAQPAESTPDDFVPKLRELLRPNVQAILRREEWPHPLYPFQEEGVLFLYEREKALLADEQGLGKTIQALAAAGLLLSTGQIQQALVLCPASLVTNWVREARRWLPRLGDGAVVVKGSGLSRHYQWHSHVPLLIAGYETFRADAAAGRLPDRPQDLVILDEAQRIKNAETELAYACKSLPRRRSWALTGTPLENRLEDLLSIIEWLTGETAAGLGGTHRLREAQRSLQLRRKKEEVALQLPPKMVVHVTLELGETQRESYHRLESEGVLELRERGESLRVTHVLALLTRLKQVCNFCPATGESAKVEYVRAQLGEILASGRQALIFSQFTDERAGLRRLAAEIGPAMAVYHGGMGEAARDLEVHRFNEGRTRVLGLSLRAGGVGLNLQRASYVFHFDRWWNPAVEWQAEDRAHRLGQELPVTVYRLVTAGTVEERIHNLLESKQVLFREIVEGAPSPQSSRLTIDELFDVLDLPVPERLREEA